MSNNIFRRTTAVTAICIFFLLLAAVLSDHAAVFDDPVREFFYSIRSDVLTAPATIITHLADKVFLIALCLLLLILPWTRLGFGVPLSAGTLAVVITNSIIKHLVQRPRPDVLHLVSEDGYSFASGHSISSMFFYGMAIWLVIRHVEDPRLRNVFVILLAIPMLLIGPTRIYLGVHYPSDVLAGWCLGYAAIAVAVEIILSVQKRKEIRVS